jgi:DNA polymerase elongation subunit (family B)
MEFSSIKEAKDFIYTYKGVQDFQIYGTDKFPRQYIAEKFRGELQYSSEYIRTFILDIEVDGADGVPDAFKAEKKITAITIYDSKTNRFITWGLKEWDKNKSEVVSKYNLDHEYRIFKDEYSMLLDFVLFWQNNYPDILTGWYSRGFDVPYIINRIKNILGERHANKLSPWGIIREKKTSIRRMGVQQEITQYDIYGIAELDYMDLYKKYGKNSESFKLDFIAQTELGERKLKYEGSLSKLYDTDHQKYIDYNIHDVNIIKLLDEKLKFLDLITEVSYAGKVPCYTDSLGTVAYWEILIYNHLHEKNIIPELKSHSGSKDDQYTGAYVKEPKPGRHEWVMSFDFQSLYPSVIRQVNIGVETLVSPEDIPSELKSLLSDVNIDNLLKKKIDTDLLKKYNFSLSVNGKLYRKDKQSLFSELMEIFFNKRKEYKKLSKTYKEEYLKTKDKKYNRLYKIYDIKQYAVKILINSFYGATGNQYFQYYSLDNAQAVTITGQLATQWVEKKLNEYMNKLLQTENHDYVIAGDTDSIYICFDSLVQKMNLRDNLQKINFLDKFANEKLTQFFSKSLEELQDYLNSYTNNLVLIRDVISDVAIWKAKKMYFMNVHDSEGVRYDTPQMKIMGVEVVKSSTPMIVRDKLRTALKTILTGKEKDLHTFIEEFRQEFSKLKPEEIAFPRGVSEMDKWIENGSATKGTPIHVKGSIIYNNLLKKYKLNELETIKDGSKVKFVYLKEPNIIRNNTIAFIGELPKEFDLEKYIDYDVQFEKTFLKPLRDILDVIGWKIEEEFNLENLFG